MSGSPKIVVVGGVAGGATAAAKARRTSESAEIVIFERGPHISFANCGLPYYVAGAIPEREKLFVTTPEKFTRRYNIRIHVEHEVTRIDRGGKRVEVLDKKAGRTFWESYDKLILSPGSSPIVPPLPGVRSRNVFTVRTVPDVDAIVSAVRDRKGGRAVVVGAGYVGLEMAEALVERGLHTTVVELLPQVLPSLDPEMADPVARHLTKKGVELILSDGLQAFEGEPEARRVVLRSGRRLDMDLAVLAIGVRPETSLAVDAGLAMGERGGITVNDRMQTSDPDIYAVGDAVEVLHLLTGKKTLLPLAGPANKQGRVAGANAAGGDLRFRGVVGTSIVKVFDLAAARTGLSEREAREHGFDAFAVHTFANHHAGYYPGARTLAIKLVVEKGGRLLGAQVVGEAGVDKRIDVFATALMAGLSVQDLEQLDLAYAPPFGSGVDPAIMAGYVASNVARGEVRANDAHRFEGELGGGIELVDVRTAKERSKGMLPGARGIELDDLRGCLDELDPTRRTVFYCGTGYRSYLATRVAVNRGFREVEHLSGGFTAWKAAGGRVEGGKTDPEDTRGGAVPGS